jgi:voltage-gated potassium channel
LTSNGVYYRIQVVASIVISHVMVMFVFSSLIYLVESREDIQTLPHEVWLVLVTMTTVGYGDVAPDTQAGHVVVGILIPLAPSSIMKMQAARVVSWATMKSPRTRTRVAPILSNSSQREDSSDGALLINGHAT